MKIKIKKIVILIVIGILIILNFKIILQLKNLDNQSKEQNGSLILSLVQYNDIVKSYIEERNYSEKELYGLSQRCISSSIEAYNLGLLSLSINYRYLGESLEKLSNTYEIVNQEEKNKHINDIEHFIETNEGIYKIISNKSESLYNITIENLKSSELIREIDEYDYNQQK